MDINPFHVKFRRLSLLFNEAEVYTEQDKAKTPVDVLFTRTETKQATPKSALGQALHYLKEQRSYLLAYFKDGRLFICGCV